MNNTVRSITALLSSNLARTILSALGGILVARFLGPEITGSFRAYTIPLIYMTFLHLGTWDGLWRQIPFYIGKDKPDKVASIAAAAGYYNFFLSIIISFAFLGFAIYSLMENELRDFSGWLSQAIAAWALFYGGYLTSTYRTLSHFVILSKILFFQAVITFLMVFSLPFLEFYGLAARVAVPAVVSVWLFHHFRPLKVNYNFNLRELGELIKLGLPFSIWGNLYTSVWLATESALILSLSGTVSLGHFSIAVVMRAAMSSLPQAIWQVLTPRVVMKFAKDEDIREANKRILWPTIGLVFATAVLVMVGSYILEYFVPAFIPKYSDGITIMKFCLWFSVIEAAFLPANVLFATGRSWLYGRSVLAGFIMFLLVSWLLLPVSGGEIAVITGSLAGKVTRVVAAYADLYLLSKMPQ